TRHGLTTVLFKIGLPSSQHRDLVIRLLRRLPRRSMVRSELPAQSSLSTILPLFPVDLYSGSGVSYEAGLPTLCDIHDLFCLDDNRNKCFTMGETDRLPGWLASQGSEVLARFCTLHVKALVADPTPAQHV